MRNFYHSRKFCTLTISFSEVWPCNPSVDNLFAVRFRKVLNRSRRRLENVLTRAVEPDDKSWKGLEDIFARRLEYVMKTYWRGLQNILKTSWRGLEDVFARLLEEVLKISWRSLEDVLKTSLQDVLKMFWIRLLNAFD